MHLADVSLYLLQPLIAGFPTVVVGVLPNCNTFTAADVSATQNQFVVAFEAAKGRERIGVLLSSSSDGDSRRRLDQIQATFGYAPSASRYRGVLHDSFVASVTISDGFPVAIGVRDQDPVQ